MAKNDDFITLAQERAAEGIPLEYALGKGLFQPFNSANSGSRKLMHSIHEDQAPQTLDGQRPIVETGHEFLFGDLSSSIIKADSDYEVVAIVPKFSFCPRCNYYIIMRDLYNNNVTVQERIDYRFNIEVYGYLYNNEVLDALQPGMIVQKDTILRKSIGYDKYMNRTPGKNLLSLYLADERNLEDSIIMLDECAETFRIPIFHKVTIIKNPNDIMVNLYGDNDRYKCFPDIGEDIQNRILVALRRENKENAAFSQSYDILRKTLLSDEKFTTNGTIVNIDVYCNSPEALSSSIYTSQLDMYYRETLRFASDLVNSVAPLKAAGYNFSYELKKLYHNSKRVLNGDMFSDDPNNQKTFSDTMIKFMVLEKRPIEIGDKMVDRYGGKGVVSYILPKELMPKLPDGTPVDIIKNQSGTYGRENIGQLMELSTTFLGRKIVEFIRTGTLTIDESLELVYQYYRNFSIELANSYANWVNSLDEYERKFIVDELMDNGHIDISLATIDECINIMQLAEIYKQFPWIKKEKLIVPIEDSNGNIRQVESRRATVCSWIYNIRLKQFAEEKFSATSLSSTNLTNLNTKSKASKEYKELFSNTPIKFGNMESGDMGHLDPRIGSMYVIVNLMIHSLSPHARRESEQQMTGDPYHVNIRLNSMASNRQVEILNTYLKTMGYRIKFVKVKKQNTSPVLLHPIKFARPPETKMPIKLVGLTDMENYIINTTKGATIDVDKKHPIKIHPIKFC